MKLVALLLAGLFCGLPAASDASSRLLLVRDNPGRRLDDSTGNSSADVDFAHIERIFSVGDTEIFVVSCNSGDTGSPGDGCHMAAAGLPGTRVLEWEVTVTADQFLPSTPWGVDRMDGLKDRVINVPSKGGAGHFVYILDTGISAGHNEFGGRVAPGVSFVGGGGEEDAGDDDGRTDCHGHGTHVASLAAGAFYGVARGATVVPVRVLGCQGSGLTSGVIRGLNWAAQDSLAERGGRKVISMSLSGARSSAMNEAVDAVVRSGVPVVVSAGNSYRDAREASPASASLAIAVGASTESDRLAGLSNHGPAVAVFAAGIGVPGARAVGGPYAVIRMSGTSMSAPHVAGAALLGIQYGCVLPGESMRDMIIAYAESCSLLGIVPSGTTRRLARLPIARTGSDTCFACRNRPPVEACAITNMPTRHPTPRPSDSPTTRPSASPTPRPTIVPTPRPSVAPATPSPTRRPPRCSRSKTQAKCKLTYPRCNWAKKKRVCYLRSLGD